MIPKFRLFDKDTKEWQSIRSIGLEEDGSILYIQCWDKYEEDIDPPYFMDNLGVGFELLQSTGLHDENGKEIFEGDIVKVSQDDDYFISFVKNMIKFDCPGFDVPFPDDWYYECNVLSHLMNTDQTIEVISNIHEHPELLNQPNE